MSQTRIQNQALQADPLMDRAQLTRYAWLSIAAALLTIGLKSLAYVLTRSVGLLSDAVESGVNLAAAIVALSILTIAARPPDDEHAYGHSKAEYFSSGVEGALILVAAASISWAAIGRLLHPRPLEGLGIGLALSTVATLVNFGVARVLLQAGKRYHSITLEADARHLMTDVWTSGGVLLALGVVTLTHWQILDPLIAIGVAINIIWSGVSLVRRSILGLMDTAIAAADQQTVIEILDRRAAEGIWYHNLRTRQSGATQFISVHVLVPGRWSVRRGHDLLEALESEIRQALPHALVTTHLEPVEDPASWDATGPHRSSGARPADTDEKRDRG
ncbi:MAG TPA: cation diffusion facilitator family transporter [Anaerolineales bacterium]|nr:cation diffusion facilitator family transporter [Anaerolineales bacterium]